MIVPFRQQAIGAMDPTMTGGATQVDVQGKLDNLGQQISSLVQQYNDLKRNLMAQNPSATKDQLTALLEQRKAAIQALIQQHVTDVHSMLSHPELVPAIPALQGLGQTTSALDSLQTQIVDEQNKLTALQNYYNAYKAAVDAGQAPPPLPSTLQSGAMGISSTMIIAGVALVAALFMFGRK